MDRLPAPASTRSVLTAGAASSITSVNLQSRWAASAAGIAASATAAATPPGIPTTIVDFLHSTMLLFLFLGCWF